MSKGGVSVKDDIQKQITKLRVLRDSLSHALAEVEGELKECEGQLEADAAIRAMCEANEFLRTKRTRALADYFRDKGLLITSLQECTDLTKQRYKLAKMIFNAPEALLPVVKLLYQRKEDRLDVSGYDAVAKTAVCNFLTQLDKMKWIDWTKQKDLITIEQKIPKEHYAFFNGGWAEDATRYLIEKTLHDIHIPHKGTYREVKVRDITGHGNVHEFDFIVEFKDRIYIFETKTGALCVDRWIDHARMFNESKGLNRFLMCCNDDTLNAKLFQPYRLFHLKTLPDEFCEYVKREFGIEDKVQKEDGTGSVRQI